ncbi:MAG: type II toxin-antitoxin system Phd/YefM family antitoxin [Thermomicrobiales bacterium]
MIRYSKVMNKATKQPSDTVPISEFKAKCIELLKAVKGSRKSLVVTLRGEPLVTVEPYRSPRQERRLGRYQDQTKILGDVVHYDWSSDWEDS